MILELGRETIFAGIAITFAVLRYATYLYSIYKREARPHVFSWFNWGLVVSIGAFAQIQLDGGPSVWVLFVVGGMCFFFAFLALFIGEKNITRSDWVAFISALFVIPVWQATSNPILAIALVFTIDLLSTYPTYRKTWVDPYSEPAFSWFLSSLRYFFAIFAVPNPTWESLLYLILLLSLEVVSVILILVRRAMLAKLKV